MSEEVREEFAAGLEEGADVSYEHDRLVHTLGNLTLSGYNSELSNRPFSQKREMLATSGLLMNQAIAEHESWGLTEIVERNANLAEKIIELWPGPDEDLAADAESAEVSALRSTVSEILAALPAGNWTSYGEVAIVAGTYPQPLAAVLARYKLPNAWRVLQTGGTVSPGFRWFDPSRTDDPRDVLASEGVKFDEAGKASVEQFLTAQELADAAGLELDDEIGSWRESGSEGAGIGAEQELFFTEVRALGQVTATNVATWRTPRAQYWYDVSVGSSRAHLSLTANSVKQRLGVELYIPNDEAMFETFYRDRHAISEELGALLEWRDLPGRKASRIITLKSGDFQDPEQRAQLQRWMVDTVDDFARVFRPRLETMV